MTDSGIAIVISIVLSLLLAIVQVASDSKISNWLSYFTIQLAFYMLIMSIGNILSTLIAQGIVEKFKLRENNEGIILAGPSWIWYAAFGVFGFEAIIQKINITIFDKGILALNDWLTKAKASAVAATLDKAADVGIETEQELGPKLHQALPKNELHTLVINIIGEDLYQKALNSVKSNGNIIPELYLAMMASSEAPKKVRAVLKSKGVK